MSKVEKYVEPDRPQTITRRMRFACWITKATHTEYVIIIFSPLQQLFRERDSLLRYNYIACLVLVFSALLFPTHTNKCFFESKRNPMCGLL
jgi:hypothetical protein